MSRDVKWRFGMLPDMGSSKSRGTCSIAAWTWMRTPRGDIVETAIWKAAHGGGGQPDLSIEVLEALISAGGKAPDRHPPVNERIDAFLTRHGSVADPKRYWSGEEPRSA